MFSPRARGCSEFVKLGLETPMVFPACAGMFLLGHTRFWRLRSFPRVRGDVPFSLCASLFVVGFSPRARGCSQRIPSLPLHQRVFPACAGMFPPAAAQGASAGCFPRVRGDVPWPVGSLRTSTSFSPRARGCSLRKIVSPTPLTVFPACAGMFLSRDFTIPVSCGFPACAGMFLA